MTTIDYTFAGKTVKLDGEKWPALPQLERDLALLIHESSMVKGLDPSRREQWVHWWGSENPWRPLFLLKHIRPLKQADRAVAQAGLATNLRRRRVSDPILKDTGILDRVVGTQWQEGVAAVLGELGKCPPEKIKDRWEGAFRHAISLRRPKSLRWLVQWAVDRDLSIDMDVSGKDLASVWRMWLEKDDMHHDDPLLGLSLKVLNIKEQSPQETEAWNFWASRTSDLGCPAAIAAWCLLHPEAWDRMHRDALLEGGPRNAWMAACARARMFGPGDVLWRQAIQAPSTPQWMRRPWGNQAESALALWMSDDVERTKSLPGSDPVSQALREMGAMEPGSPLERLQGGPSLIDLIPSYLLVPKWFKDYPQWALPHPKTGQTPLFKDISWEHAKRYRACGLSWFHCDLEGENAYASFLCSSKRQWDGRVKNSQEALRMWENGELPLVGHAKGKTIAGSVARIHRKSLFEGFCLLRMKFDQALDPMETQQVVAMGDLGFAAYWKRIAVGEGKWTEFQEQAFWRGALIHGLLEEYGDPKLAIECPDEPAWTLALAGDVEDYNRLRMLRDVQVMGLSAIQALHPLWEQEEPSRIWVELVSSEDTKDLTGLGPLDATNEWWAARVRQWERLLDDGYATPAFLRNAMSMGMPLEGEVMQAITTSPGILVLAHADHEISAWINHAILEQAAPAAKATRSSRL